MVLLFAYLLLWLRLWSFAHEKCAKLHIFFDIRKKKVQFVGEEGCFRVSKLKILRTETKKPT